MKKLMIAAALTAIAASPALAQQVPWSAWQTPVQYTPSQAYMYAPSQGYEQSSMGFVGIAPGVVVDSGMIIGQDPDADVRLQLRREALLNDGLTPHQ